MKLDEDEGLRITVVGKGPETWQWSVFSGPPMGQFEKQHAMGWSSTRAEAYQLAASVCQQVIWNSHPGLGIGAGLTRLPSTPHALSRGPTASELAELNAKFDKEYPEEDEDEKDEKDEEDEDEKDEKDEEDEEDEKDEEDGSCRHCHCPFTEDGVISMNHSTLCPQYGQRGS